MIITILGADFSASNIGTLSSYLVRYTGNVTGNVTTVEKNDAGTSAKNALSATITMKSGFTYESLSVTVGGSTITGYTATDNGNGTVSLTVPANLITGTVVISVVTTGTSVNPPSGEPEEPGTGGGGSGDIDISGVQIEVKLLANSYISKDSGEIVTNETYKNWIATDYISVNANEKYKVVANTFTGGSSGVGAAVYGYDSNKTPLICILGETDASSGAMFSIPENVKYIRVGTIKTKCAISLFKLNIPDDLPYISWIANQYVSKETKGTTPVAAGTIKDASGWTTTNYIDVSKYKKLTYTATIPTGGISTVHCVYGYDSNKNPIKPILTPTNESNTFNNYLIEIVDSDIAYIVACGHSKTLVPSISFTN